MYLLRSWLLYHKYCIVYCTKPKLRYCIVTILLLLSIPYHNTLLHINKNPLKPNPTDWPFVCSFWPNTNWLIERPGCCVHLILVQKYTYRLIDYSLIIITYSLFHSIVEEEKTFETYWILWFEKWYRK